MTYRRLSYLLVSITCLLMAMACGTKIEYEKKYVAVLQASDIYSPDSVKAYLAKYKDANKSVADGYGKSADSLSKANNADKAIYAAKRAVTLYPSKENYLHLAEKLKIKNSNEELADLYGLLCNKHYSYKSEESTFLFEAPDKDLVYEHIVYGALTGRYYSGEDAEELHLDKAWVREKLFREPRIAIDRNSVAFQNIIVPMMNMEDLKSYAAKPEVFGTFLSTFKDSSGVFTIDQKNIHKFKYAENTSGDEEEGILLDFNVVSMEYLYEKQVDSNFYAQVNFIEQHKLNDKVRAIVYAIDTSANACPVTMRQIYYQLITMNEKGAIIDHKIIATQSGAELNTVTFNKNAFTIVTNRRNWEKPYQRNDFSNELTGIEKTGSADYIIQDNGSIVAKPQS